MGKIGEEEEKELQKNHLFRALDRGQMEALQPHISIKSLKQGEHLFEEGQKAEAFYLLRQGQIKLYRLAPSGQEKVIEIVRPGHSFAEALMFLEVPAYPLSAQALTNVELFVIRNRGFLELLSGSVETCFHVMADISVRLKGLLNEIDALTLQNASLRLVNFLLYLVQEQEVCEGCVEITLPAAKNIIASRLSIQPETLSRILANLGNQGLISVEGLNITVHDPEGLRTYGD
ncbi:MAG: Crp/Fnr family transcriptional regulator [Gammaproteobacteria bacterium]|nr:Crp/Fnr family transcriptional regulator [Gammaproteobacteria bacterium]MCW8993624.1 Crp/Fnr family transcriptional regulator [Gammaproteobacteria bacterium]MCW9087982.1 Crp/Fnr family transcriptional regulator [Gammaproteobacteria bacterium]